MVPEDIEAIDLDIDITKRIVGKNNLDKKCFCVTGAFHSISRSELEDLIINNGGKFHQTVGKRTDFLITAEFLEDGRRAEEGKKYQRASEIANCKILTED